MSNLEYAPPANGAVACHEKAKNSISVSAVELDEETDLGRWRLLDERGRQTWHYMSTDEAAAAWPQTVADKHHLGLPLVKPPRHEFDQF